MLSVDRAATKEGRIFKASSPKRLETTKKKINNIRETASSVLPTRPLYHGPYVLVRRNSSTVFTLLEVIRPPTPPLTENYFVPVPSGQNLKIVGWMGICGRVLLYTYKNVKISRYLKYQHFRGLRNNKQQLAKLW